MLIIAHELRHIDQYRRGFSLSLQYDILEYVRQTFAVEADAQSFMIYLAWSLRRTGDETLWREVGGLEHYEDIVKAFDESMRSGASTLEAMRKAFTAWYASPWRRAVYFEAAAMRYLDKRDSNHAIPTDKRLPHDHFDQLCRLPDGTNYGCQFTSEISSKVTGRPFP